MSEHGFFSLGQIIAGGDPRPGEEAFLEGLDTGSRIRSRNASTESAIQNARLRRNKAQAQDELKSLSEELGVDPAMITSAIAGIDPRQFTGAQKDVQGIGFRETIADIDVPFEQRQASAQAVSGKPIDPFQFGPGGELFTDVFNPDLQISPTGESQIALDAARTEKAKRQAGLALKRTTNPELFKSSTTFNLGLPSGKGLGDAILDDIGGSTIPADIKPEAATGITGFGAALANTAFDIGNFDLPFPDTDTAANAMTDLMTRTQITGGQAIPGRETDFIRMQLAKFGVEPNNPFTGDQKSFNRLTQTSRFLGGEADRIRRALNFSAQRMSKRDLADNEAALRSLTSLKQDYDVVISRFNIDERTTKTAAGGSFTVDE